MATRRKKRQKSEHNEEIDKNMNDTEMQDISDDDTIAQTKNDERNCTFSEVSFLKMSVKQFCETRNLLGESQKCL